MVGDRLAIDREDVWGLLENFELPIDTTHAQLDFDVVIAYRRTVNVHVDVHGWSNSQTGLSVRER